MDCTKKSTGKETARARDTHTHTQGSRTYTTDIQLLWRRAFPSERGHRRGFERGREKEEKTATGRSRVGAR